jgi:hypothetical protein
LGAKLARRVARAEPVPIRTQRRVEAIITRVVVQDPVARLAMPTKRTRVPVRLPCDVEEVYTKWIWLI